MSTPSSANTPASSRSSKIPTLLTSTPHSIRGSPSLPSAISTPTTKRSLDQSNDRNLGRDGFQPSRRIFSESATGRFDLQGRKPGNRDSGGFLLEPLSFFSKRKRSAEKSRAEQPSNTNLHEANGSPGSITGSINGVETPVPDVKGKGKGKATPTSDHARKTVPTTSPSPVSDRVGSMEQSSRSHGVGMDPTQIVQMALSLSESRRLNLSPGHLAPAALPGNRRAVSAGHAPSALTWQGNGAPSGGSNRHDTLSGLHPDHGSMSTKPSSDWSATSGVETSGSQGNHVLYNFNFTSATLARADNAKLHFELLHEYRRLLGYLPPLKPGTGSDGSQELGRVYNPLQYIRNRQVRTRERQTLDVKNTGWTSVEAVRLWVDTVEVESQSAETRSGDVVLLPPWNQKLRKSGVQSTAPWLPPPSPDNGTNILKAKWAKLDWTITPADLLADAYWLEQRRHKALIEARSGDRIFDRFRPPRDIPSSFERVRKSHETSYGRISEASDSPEHIRRSQSMSSPPEHRTHTFYKRSEGSPSPPPKRSKVARVKRHFLRRHREDPDMSMDSDASDLDHLDVEDFEKRGTMRYENIGPLEKHMNRMLELDSRGKSNRSQRISSIESTQNARRGGVSTDTTAESGHELQRSSTDMISNRASLEAYPTATPRISIEDADAPDGLLSQQTTTSFNDENSEAKNEDLVITKKTRSNPLNFLRKTKKAAERENIEVTDFAAIDNVENPRKSFSSVRNDDSPRSSIEMGPRSDPYRSLNNTQRGSRRKSHDDLAKSPDQTQPNSSTTKFFKGGRIGEIVRSERPRTGGFVWKRKAPRQRSEEPNKPDNSLSESEDDESRLSVTSNDYADGRSRSTNDLNHGAYRMKDLPAFKPTLARGSTKAADTNNTKHDDHISRQANAQRAQNRRSRFDRMAPLSVKTSRATSSTDLSRQSTFDSNNRDRDRSPGDNRSSSRSRSGVRAADKRLNAVLRDPGGVGRGGLPVTGLATVDARRRSRSARAEGHRHWSIADDAARPDLKSTTAVTTREIAYVRSLLLASGIKANAIVSKANEPREKLPDFLIQAARLSKTSLGNVGRRQEHVLAARMLSHNLEATISAFEKAAEEFRGETCSQLHSRIDDLREQVGSKLTPLVRSCGDDADAFIAQLTTTHTLAIKQVNDSVELMMRSRRRRLRWLRKAGFALLEWVLVGLMWWIWLFVYVLKIFRGLLVGSWRAVRWVSWS